MPVWLRKSVVLAMHQMMLAEFGGASGIRDEGLLESALARPQHLHAYEENADLAALAAAYAAGLTKNHPFVDGNKRVGFMAAFVFLERNGLELTAAETDATAAMLDLAAGRLDEGALAAWLRDNVRKMRKSKVPSRAT